MTIKNIVLSGGAYKGFYTIGALKYLSNIQFFNINDIENIYGVSVGSLIGLILCLKLDWGDMIEHAINRPWQNLFQFGAEDILDVFVKKGLMKKSFIYNIFDNFFKNAGLSKTITMKELYDYSNINLHIYTTNISTFKLVEITHQSHPDIKVLDAVYMSCSMPFIFQPEFIEGACYVDGGVINPYPLNICLKYHSNKDEILAFKIVDDVLEPVKESSSIFQYGFYMLYRLIKENYNFSINEEMTNEIIIPSSMINVEDAGKIIKDPEIRRKMILQGENYAKLFLSYKTKNKLINKISKNKVNKKL